MLLLQQDSRMPLSLREVVVVVQIRDSKLQTPEVVVIDTGRLKQMGQTEQRKGK